MTDQEVELNAGKPPRPDTKICSVCGDSALGYNFDAVTCESCKAFFRRNALKNKEFRCPFSNQCKITSVTRRFCQKCRLQKCFSVGMKKELIMTEEDKEKKRRKIEENRMTKKWKKQLENCSDVSSLTDNYVSSSSMITNSASIDMQKGECEVTESLLQPLSVVYQPAEGGGLMTFPSPRPAPSPPPDTASIAAFSDAQLYDHGVSLAPSVPSQYPNNRNNVTSYPEIQSTPLLVSLVNSHKNDTAGESIPPMGIPIPSTNGSYHSKDEQERRAKDIMEEILRIPTSAPDSIDSVLSEAIKLEFECCPILSKSLPTLRSNSRQLNAAEYAKLNELIVAHKGLGNPIDKDMGGVTLTVTEMKDVFALTALAIRRFIRMSKQIDAFRNMCQEDQIALLKGGCTELMILRSVTTYDKEKDTWKIQQTADKTTSIKIDILKEVKGSLYEEHRRFLYSFDEQVRNDENIMLILSAITLFSPDRAKIVHRDVIKLEQNSYYYLLRRYLESVYPGCEARSMFLKLIQKLNELHRLNETHMRYFLNLNPHDIEPLLIEIFDLKPH